MIHTSARGIAQLGFHIAEEEDAAVDVPQLSFSTQNSGVPNTLKMHYWNYSFNKIILLKNKIK